MSLVRTRRRKTKAGTEPKDSLLASAEQMLKGTRGKGLLRTFNGAAIGNFVDEKVGNVGVDDGDEKEYENDDGFEEDEDEDLGGRF